MRNAILKCIVFISLLGLSLGCADSASSTTEATVEEDATSGIPQAVPQSRFNEPDDATIAIGEYTDIKGSTEVADVIEAPDVPEGGCLGNENCAQDNLPPCTMAVCLNGSCEIVAGQDGLPCDDDNVCTEETLCNAAEGGCVGGTQTDCDDGDACTIDSCDPTLGCTSSPGTGECDDGDICTVGDVCENGVCNPGEVIACNDDNPCTADQCDPIVGCLYPSLEGEPCDDGEQCTVGDACSNGSCVGGEVQCDICDDETPCEDPEDLCLGNFTCSPTGFCVAIPSTVIVCDDGNSCTEDSCEPTTGECSTTVIEDDTPCDDGNDCTLGDSCSAGVCKSSNFAAGGSICEDGNPCTLLDTCENGVCNPGAKEAGCTPGCVEAPLMQGCDGCACEECVCDMNPACCDTMWDAECAIMCDEECDGCAETTEGGGTEGGGGGGLCDGICGSFSPDGSCYCDDLCFTSGDCCSGICTDCPTLDSCNGGGGGSGECAGQCGGSSASGLCYCDDACFGYGDCCTGICNDCPNLLSCDGGTGGGGGCAAGEILDCNGVCAPQGWLGDGSCDDGTFGSNFNCASLNFDNGDCSSGGCGLFDVLDCYGGCTSESWIGDGICDFALDCAQFNFDGGDCGGSSGGGATCGNGIIEEGETCDGNCPFSDFDCPDVDGDPCTKDTVVGDYFSCTSECVVETVTTCDSFDGCCLPECSWPSDLDCTMPICGDGIVDQGELCDGDCPTQSDCDLLTVDGCFPYSLKGSASICTAECVPQEQILCQDDDGCCPQSCEDFPSLDNDCEAVTTEGGDEDAGGETDGGTGEEGEEGGDEACLPGEVLSCSGFTCVTELWIGDGNCDDTLLNCDANQFDGGDCAQEF